MDRVRVVISFSTTTTLILEISTRHVHSRAWEAFKSEEQLRDVLRRILVSKLIPLRIYYYLNVEVDVAKLFFFSEFISRAALLGLCRRTCSVEANYILAFASLVLLLDSHFFFHSQENVDRSQDPIIGTEDDVIWHGEFVGADPIITLLKPGAT